MNTESDTSNFVKKTGYHKEYITKYISTQEFFNLTVEKCTARLEQAYLATKADIND